MQYKIVLSNFAYTAAVRKETERAIAVMKRPHHAQAAHPRIDALLEEDDVRVGMKLLKNGMPAEYRSLEFLLFSELVPGYREAVLEAISEDKEVEEILPPDQIITAEDIVICGLALMRALSRHCYPYHMHEEVPWNEFVATVRRAATMGDVPNYIVTTA